MLPFLAKAEEIYLTNCAPQELKLTFARTLEAQDSILFRVDEVTYEEEAPWKEALENVLSAARIPGINFIYLLQGDRNGVRFYYGLSRDHSTALDSELSIPEIGESVLKASLEGNFRGSEVVKLTAAEKDPVLERLRKMRYVSRVEGVAGSIKDDERFQSVDRLVDVMQGEEFVLLVIAKALRQKEIEDIESTIYEAYNALSPYQTLTRQESLSSGTNQGTTKTSGTNKGYSENQSKSTAKGTQVSTQSPHGKTTGSGSSSSSESHTTTNNATEQTGSGRSEGSSESTSQQSGSNEGHSWSLNTEYTDRCVQEWLKYCDEAILPRLDYGKGKGLFTSAFYAMTKSPSALVKLENTVLSLYSGKQGSRVPLRTFSLKAPKLPLKGNGEQLNAAYQLQMPSGRFTSPIDREQLTARAFLSQPVSATDDFPIGNWITTNELAMIAGLPRKEVAGLRLRAEVEFGFNCKIPEEKDRLRLGRMVQNGRIINIPVYLDKQTLDKHIFVSGVTGSGKTTTCQKLLVQSGHPFLVIEPAKTEYRIIKNNTACEDLLVFTLGDENVAPFRMNPLEFQPKESISSHVDMLKASIEAAFDMEAAIPQLIERALYACYEKYGWDIQTGENDRCSDPFAPNASAFPRLSDLLDVIEDVVVEQGFDARLKDEYIGSIKARLQSLVLGAKGDMLDAVRSIDWDALLDKKVVFELEGIKSGSEKSLVMGFILTAFIEAVRERYLREGRQHAHILLVEEAHRLLSRFTPGDSLNKKHGVETFSDMLAEIRRYGECLIIADQIPNKMAEDVLKNTNTKIVHRIFAQDDKDTIGSTMALSKEQKDFLSNLATGRAVLFADGIGQAVQIQIDKDTDTSEAPLKDTVLRERAFRYYYTECRRPILLRPTADIAGWPVERREYVLRFITTDMLRRILHPKWDEHRAKRLADMLEWNVFQPKDMVDWLIMSRPGLAELLGTERENGMRETLLQYIMAYPQGREALDLIDNDEYFQLH